MSSFYEKSFSKEKVQGFLGFFFFVGDARDMMEGKGGIL